MGTSPMPGRFRLSNQPPGLRAGIDPWGEGQRRVRAILHSIQQDVFEGATARVRQILSSPHELYRVEVEREEWSYLRTTILDRDALEALIEETPEQLVEERFSFS